MTINNTWERIITFFQDPILSLFPKTKVKYKPDRIIPPCETKYSTKKNLSIPKVNSGVRRD